MRRLLYEPRPTWDANAQIPQGPTQAHAVSGLGIRDGYDCDRGDGEQSKTVFGIHGMTSLMSDTEAVSSLFLKTPDQKSARELRRVFASSG